VLTAASSDYMVGSFDGKKFTPETPKLKGHRGRGFYAAQTFSDLPASDGRRIQIGWFQAPAPGMPFNQAMTVPLELKLVGTAEGPRLSWTPVKELESLRGDSKKFGPTDLKEGDDALASAGGETLDVRMDFEPGDAKEVGINVRGVTIRYDVAKQELSVNDLKAPAPLRGGRQRLIVLADRNCFEVFASDGLTYVPFPVIPKASDLGVRAWAKGGTAKIQSVQVNQLKGIWKQASP
jgi:sucrose-6-phosphate hydrolase SacC (GH32 family)